MEAGFVSDYARATAERQQLGAIADRYDHEGHPFPSEKPETGNFSPPRHTSPLDTCWLSAMARFMSALVLAAGR